MISANVNTVNVGSSEQPVLLPKEAIDPRTLRGREWWGKVVEGSVVLTEEQLAEF